MTLLIGLSVALLGPMAVVAVVNLWLAPRLHRSPREYRPRASVLVPARNEARNLRSVLPALLELDEAALEVLVLDDDSEDGTAGLIAAAEKASAGRLRLLHGAPLPDGWTGKNWACHQLAAAARGEVLIFCDADVRPGPDAVSRTLGAMLAQNAQALTALPRQSFATWSTEAVVPLVAWLPVVALLPLPLVHRMPSASVAMGNGQWLAFTRDGYAATGGHAAVRGDVLEDVALARRVKLTGGRLLVAAAPHTLEVRMYRGWRDMKEGFGKNLYALSGGTPTRFAAVMGIFLLVALLPLLAPFGGAGWMLWAPALLLLIRVAGAGLLGQSARSVLLHPFGAMLILILAVGSARHSGRSLRWKGRTLPVAHQPGVNGSAEPLEMVDGGPAR